MTSGDRIAYDFAVLRAVPHVHLGAFVPVGVLVHARTTGYLGMRVLSDSTELATRVPDVDHELLARYLRSHCAVAAGDATAGPVGLAPSSERFHWLTAPRSTVIQTSPVHSGRCDDHATMLERLLDAMVRAPTRREPAP